MKQMLRNKRTWLLLAVALLVCTMSVGTTLAYFTANAEAEGGHVLELGHFTKIREEFSNWTKHVTLTNTGDRDCYVRLKAFSSSDLELNYISQSEKWSLGDDGYYYYSDIVPIGGETEPIDIKIDIPEGYTQDFNVVVIQECTLVLFEGDEPYADWSMVFDHNDDSFEVGGE